MHLLWPPKPFFPALHSHARLALHFHYDVNTWEEFRDQIWQQGVCGGKTEPACGTCTVSLSLPIFYVKHLYTSFVTFNFLFFLPPQFYLTKNCCSQCKKSMLPRCNKQLYFYGWCFVLVTIQCKKKKIGEGNRATMRFVNTVVLYVNTVHTVSVVIQRSSCTKLYIFVVVGAKQVFV